MREIRISQERFDTEALLDRTVHFLKKRVSTEVHPTYAIVWVQSLGDVPVYGPESGWKVLSALKQEGKIVFFPLAYVDHDGRLTCADENTHRPASDYENPVEETLIGLENSVGYLVQIKKGMVIINSAIHGGGGCPGPAPRVGLRSSCGILDGPMEKFMRSFIKG